ncbi:hypothetical protein N7478_002608 [Penicillium angulare]|uniref:uncharacterized protein n=1 Tax=Penicillium angulare TaxID=116970 RepID=UPI002541D125|nr:uncharacterized protein N7478_002608 [Penicillium angulare]KAJ5286922.1 hypothetical protein N7478_002608 [Penicillium angulare]
MDPPQVQLPGSDRTDAQRQAQNESNSTQNTSNSVEIDMGGTQETATQNVTATEDATLPDAQPEAEAAPEPPTPAKKLVAPSFLK